MSSLESRERLADDLEQSVLAGMLLSIGAMLALSFASVAESGSASQKLLFAAGELDDRCTPGPSSEELAATCNSSLSDVAHS